MEIHKYICDHCGKELDEKKWTILQNYNGSRYDGLDEEWEHYSVKNTYHLCPDCWKKFEKLILNK